MSTITKETMYKGWKNRATWNVALWIGNDESLYRRAVSFMRSYKGRAPYAAFAARTFGQDERTLDGFKWRGQALCYSELNAMMCDLI